MVRCCKSLKNISGEKLAEYYSRFTTSEATCGESDDEEGEQVEEEAEESSAPSDIQPAVVALAATAPVTIMSQPEAPSAKADEIKELKEMVKRQDETIRLLVVQMQKVLQLMAQKNGVDPKTVVEVKLPEA